MAPGRKPYEMMMRTLFLICLLACSSQSIHTPTKINGLCLVAPSFDISADHYNPVLDAGANWVAVIPYAFCSPSRPEVTFDHPRQWVGEKTQGVTKAIKLAQNAGLKVMLKPHLWVMGQGWAGDLKFENEQDVKTWMESYSTYLLHFSALAEDLDVDMIAVGTEVRHMATEYTDFWISLIAEVKRIYSGQLTYAANWDNYQNINFWNELDYIGIDAYFPSQPVKTPAVDYLIAHNDSVKLEIKKVSDSYLKKVLFTEYGFRSIDNCAAGHWNIQKKNQNINHVAQANAYQAFFESYWNEDWIVGGFVWKWHYDHPTAGGKADKEFTPQNKLAEKILRTRYTNNKKN